MSTVPILECRDINKTYTQATLPVRSLREKCVLWKRKKTLQHIKALQDISLTVQSGEWLGVYGPNGSGKTTLLQIVGGLLSQDTGEIVRRGTISCFFTLGVGFHDEKVARDNIQLHGLLHGMSSAQIQKHTQDILSFADVDSHLDLPLKCYSTGMRMRLAYAAAAHVDSDLYLFDEIMAVGDTQFHKKCVQHMDRLRNLGKAAIIVNHNEAKLEELCDRIVYLDAGRIARQRVL